MMVETNPGINEQCIKNDDEVWVISDEDKKIARRSCHEKLWNIEFAWGRNTLSEADAISGVPHLTPKDMVRESITKTKKGNASRTTDVASETVILGI